jgi:hypothetical protein
MDDFNDTPENRVPAFGGEPGEPVPEVDPDDLKTIWEMGRDLQARYPGQQVATGIGIFEHACKPRANIEATHYRASLLSLMTLFASEQLTRFTEDGQLDDAVFRAAAKVPMEWMGVGIVRQGPPFNMDEFLRLCGEPNEKAGSPTSLARNDRAKVVRPVVTEPEQSR